MTASDDSVLMQRTVSVLTPRARELVAHFYGRLFGRCPEFEALFESSSFHEQHAKLWALLRFVASSGAGTEQYAARFEDLRELHGRLGLREEDFRVFAEELLASLRYFVGPQWSEETASAWSAAIDLAVRAMSGANSGAAVASVAPRRET